MKMQFATLVILGTMLSTAHAVPMSLTCGRYKITISMKESTFGGVTSSVSLMRGGQNRGVVYPEQFHANKKEALDFYLDHTIQLTDDYNVYGDFSLKQKKFTEIEMSNFTSKTYACR